MVCCVHSTTNRQFQTQVDEQINSCAQNCLWINCSTTHVMVWSKCFDWWRWLKLFDKFKKIIFLKPEMSETVKDDVLLIAFGKMMRFTWNDTHPVSLMRIYQGTLRLKRWISSFGSGKWIKRLDSKLNHDHCLWLTLPTFNVSLCHHWWLISTIEY